MHRRQLLSTTALAIAATGCITNSIDPMNSNNSDNTDDSNDDSNADDPERRVDEPPHDIQRPDEDDWNDDYLGEGMAQEPSLGFEVITTSRANLPGFPISTDTPGEYRVDLLTTEDEREEHLSLDDMDSDTGDRVEAIDFETHVLVLVRSGWGSGSIQHRWARVEARDDGVYLHGYYTNPQVQTEDWTWRGSLVAVERLDTEVERARVSLTVDEDRRINFDSTEGTISLEE